MKTRIKVIINGKICTGRAGQTLLEIAQNNGIEIPNLCHNGELKHYGGCSLCGGSGGKPQTSAGLFHGGAGWPGDLYRIGAGGSDPENQH